VLLLLLLLHRLFGDVGNGEVKDGIGRVGRRRYGLCVRERDGGSGCKRVRYY
jgi:hypothetical protein